MWHGVSASSHLVRGVSMVLIFDSGDRNDDSVFHGLKMVFCRLRVCVYGVRLWAAERSVDFMTV